MTNDQNDRPLTLDEAYRAAFHFIAQYYARQRIEPLFLMLHSMQIAGDGIPNDPATWNDWLASVKAARESVELPDHLEPPPDPG